jgi:hypothetical protein
MTNTASRHRATKQSPSRHCEPREARRSNPEKIKRVNLFPEDPVCSFFLRPPPVAAARNDGVNRNNRKNSTTITTTLLTLQKIKKMKKHLILCVAAMAGMMVASCDLIEKATERDFEVGDFDFTVNTTVMATRAEGGTHFTGSATITRDELLGGVSFDFDMVKNITVGAVSIEVVQELAGVTIESLTLTCGGSGVTPVTMTNVPLTGIGTSQQAALKAFAAGVSMKTFTAGQTTVSVDATFDKEISEATVGYLIELSEIVVRAGLNL